MTTKVVQPIVEVTEKSTPVPQSPSLKTRAAAVSLVFGSAISQNLFADADFVKANNNECGIVTSEARWKMNGLEPNNGVFQFATADQELAYAQGLGIPIRGHALVFPGNEPAWVSTAVTSAATATTVLTNYINTVMAHYKGKVAVWNVLSEIMNIPDGNPGGYKNSIWYTYLGAGAYTLALELAFAADPAAVLCYNEQGLEQNDAGTMAKRQAVFAALQSWVRAGVPIRRLAFESHLFSGFPSNFDNGSYAAFCAQVANLGLTIDLTEFDIEDDVTFSPVESTRDTAMAAIATTYMAAAVSQPALRVIESWELSDRDSWRNRAPYLRTDHLASRPSLLDQAYRVKAMYNAVGSAIDARVTNTLQKDCIVRLGQPQSGAIISSVFGTGAVGAVTASVSAGGSFANYPNLPAGWAIVAFKQNNAVNEVGWIQDNGGLPGNIGLLNDPTAPFSPLVMQITVPAGTTGGASVCQQDLSVNGGSSGGFRQIYLAWQYWYSPGFTTDTGAILKQFYIEGNPGGTDFATAAFCAVGDPGPQSPWQLQLRTQEASTLNLPPNVPGQTGVVFGDNTWIRMEAIVVMNTPGNADGTYRLWFNGVQISNYTGIQFGRNGAGAAQEKWADVQQTLIWGGSGGTVGATQFSRIGQSLVAGSN